MSNHQNNQVESLADMFKALGNPNRLQIFLRLLEICPPGTVWSAAHEGRCHASEAGDGLDIAPSTVSHHLKELFRSGLVRMERRGRNVDFWVNPVALETITGLLKPGVKQSTGIAETLSGEPQPVSMLDHDQVRSRVQERYAKVALAVDMEPENGEGPGFGPSSAGSTRLGYNETELSSVPREADLGLGCGNPVTFAGLKEREVVLDLGSGAGLDALLASARVGTQGRVIGVDMTPEMLDKAKDNAARAGKNNVEFRLGKIEELPVEDQVADVVLSNCVINLSPDKPSVFKEAHRVLKPGGRLAILDVVALRDMPPEITNDETLLTGCVAGAVKVDELRVLLDRAGFTDISIKVDQSSRDFIAEWVPGLHAEQYIASAAIEAVKPSAPAQP
ncbi:MAG: arsenite methyltransferase [Desulfarculaceae bacterium]|jgi:SAM-dependent methyltransferase/DNA-binding transcriptional ArsR family regulator